MTSPRAPAPSSLRSVEELGRADLKAVLADPARKQAFVTPMFEHIAPRYDAFTRLFSFGMDRGWKAQLVAEVASGSPDARDLLDVACGTGDLALRAARALPHACVTGIDAASRMIEQAQVRLAADHAITAPERVSFTCGDLTALDRPTASVDVITAGYAFRNVPALSLALAEMHRVLRPGGRLFVLDFYRPENSVWRALFVRYLWAAGSAVGWWWHREPVIYSYIAASIAGYVTMAGFADALRGAGFRLEREVRFLGGGIGLQIAVALPVAAGACRSAKG